MTRQGAVCTSGLADRDPWSRRGGVRRAGVSSMLVAAIALLSACSSGSGPKVASLGGPAPTSTATSAPLSAADREAALRKFSTCMRTNGVASFPDPTVDAQGNARISGLRGLDRSSPTTQKALTACRPLLAALRQSFTPADRQKIQDALLAYASCMRSNGFQLADPNFGVAPSPGSRGGGPFGEINRNDPNFTKADTICRPKTLSGLPGGGRGFGFGGGLGGSRGA